MHQETTKSRQGAFSTKIADPACAMPKEFEQFVLEQSGHLVEKQQKLSASARISDERIEQLAQALIRAANGLPPERVPVVDEIFAYHVGKVENHVATAEIAWQRIEIPETMLSSFQESMKKYGVQINWIVPR